MKLPYHRYELYEASVQDPENEMEFFERVYEEVFGNKPHVLREDFCATFRNSCAWVRRDVKNQAFAVDLCKETLAYGKAHVSHITQEEYKRISVINKNAMDVKTPAADLVSVSNFSIGYLQERKMLVQYFKNNLKSLKKQGLMVFDLLGGQEISVPQEEKRSFSMPDGTKVKYIWDHDDFNPINNAARFYIHYKFRGKPLFERVFEYHWRMWGISEMRDCLLEAGFDDVKVYWEEDDEDTDEGSGYFSEHQDADDCPVWIAYMVGVKNKK